MDVVRDVLDKGVIDRNGREMGRVDGILLDVEPDQPARLAAIVIGPAALADRLQPSLGRFVRRMEQWCGLDRNRPTQIDFTEIDRLAPKVQVRLAIGETTVDAIEQRLRAWVLRLPGAR